MKKEVKYIVWDLISDYDGYSEIECDTWEEAVACVREVCDRDKKAKALFEKWLKGKIDKIEVRRPCSALGGSLTTDVLVFVTSARLKGPIK